MLFFSFTDDFLAFAFKLSSIKHDGSAASLTLDFNISTHANDLPLFAFLARVFFLHFNDVAHSVSFNHGVPLSSYMPEVCSSEAL